MTKLAATTFHGGRSLKESELQPLSRSCPFCNSDDVRKAILQLQSDPDISLLECQECKGISSSRMPTQHALADYYSRYYDRCTEELITFSKPERLAKRITSYAGFLASRNEIAILDFGGGDGTVAKLIAECLIHQNPTAKIKIVVIDYTTQRCVINNASVSMHHLDNLAQLDGRFDIIVASAILEHIPEFRTTLDKLLSLGAEKAIFYARTPYMAPLAKILPIDMTYPAHVHDIGALTWRWLAKHTSQNITVLKSAPSIVETTLASNAVRTIAAYALKAPASVLAAMGFRPIWPFYGGWEVIWHIQGRAEA